MNNFEVKRLGLLMEPEPGNPQEVGGVLNPAATRGPEGNLYLFPRLVAKKNYSRIGIEFVHVDNKDASLFPIAIPNHRGKLQLAMIHRPLFAGWSTEGATQFLRR